MSRILLAMPLLAGLLAAQGSKSAGPDLQSKAAATAGADKALAYFVKVQHADGSWGTFNRASQFDGFFYYSSFYGMQFGAHTLITLALLQAPETKERRAALDKALRWTLTAPIPKRSGRDKGPIWGWLFGLEAITLAVKDLRFQDEKWLKPMAKRGKEFAYWLQKNQEAAGGLGYYDYKPYQRGRTRAVESATSFTTAAALPGLENARELDWLSPKFVQRAVKYVKKCRLANGAYQYHYTPIPSHRIAGEHIDNVKGSLGRIQVCHYALSKCSDRDLTTKMVRNGVEQFFEHQRFLNVARMRPIPHEAYYANAGYFYYFGHYYCSHTINLLPEKEREGFHRQLRRHILKTQRKNGSFCDFLGTPYLTHASTAFAAMSLMNGLKDG